MPGSLLVAVLAGLLHAAAMATPWDRQPAGWLQLLALGSLAALLARCTSPRRGAALGWAFATAWLTGTFWWLFVAMHTYAGLPAALAALAVLLLAAALGGYYAGACALFVAVAPVRQGLAAIVFGAIWVLAEMARGIWLTGFGWGAAAYAHLDGMASLARVVGAYGVCALVAALAYALATSLRSPVNLRRLTGAAVVLAVGLVAGLTQREYSTSAGRLGVALLQGNIAQDEKFETGTGVADALRWYGEQLQQSAAPLVVAPETALPLLMQQLPEGYWAALQARFGQGSQAALLGIPLGSFQTGYTNSVVGLKPAATPAGALYQYDKHHLVPFGEFIPPLFRWFTDLMNIPLGDFNRGDVGQASFAWQGQRLAPNVCYEDLFGEELGARFTDPLAAPTIFVNVSNIGWFGNTVAIDQHLQISRMRAIEFERPFVRATNTGDTAIIDHTGRVVRSLPRHSRGVLTGEVEGRNGITPYAWWVSRFWLWPMWGLAIAIVFIAGWARLAGATDRKS